LHGRVVVAQHTAFAYLWDWLAIDQIADLEPKPGLPPSMAHLQQLLQQVRGDPPMAVVQSLYQDPQPGQWLAQQVGKPVLVLPTTVTSDGPAAGLAGLYDTVIDALLKVATAP
jgi:zinc/manganese transport system substrate-binding protein